MSTATSSSLDPIVLRPVPAFPRVDSDSRRTVGESIASIDVEVALDVRRFARGMAFGVHSLVAATDPATTTIRVHYGAFPWMCLLAKAICIDDGDAVKKILAENRYGDDVNFLTDESFVSISNTPVSFAFLAVRYDARDALVAILTYYTESESSRQYVLMMFVSEGVTLLDALVAAGARKCVNGLLQTYMPMKTSGTGRAELDDRTSFCNFVAGGPPKITMQSFIHYVNGEPQSGVSMAASVSPSRAAIGCAIVRGTMGALSTLFDFAAVGLDWPTTRKNFESQAAAIRVSAVRGALHPLVRFVEEHYDGKFDYKDAEGNDTTILHLALEGMVMIKSDARMYTDRTRNVIRYLAAGYYGHTLPEADVVDCRLSISVSPAVREAMQCRVAPAAVRNNVLQAGLLGFAYTPLSLAVLVANEDTIRDIYKYAAIYEESLGTPPAPVGRPTVSVAELALRSGGSHLGGYVATLVGHRQPGKPPRPVTSDIGTPEPERSGAAVSAAVSASVSPEGPSRPPAKARPGPPSLSEQLAANGAKRARVRRDITTHTPRMRGMLTETEIAASTRKMKAHKKRAV